MCSSKEVHDPGKAEGSTAPARVSNALDRDGDQTWRIFYEFDNRLDIDARAASKKEKSSLWWRFERWEVFGWPIMKTLDLVFWSDELLTDIET